MAEYNGNNAYLAIDGVVLGAYFQELELSPSIASVDTTAGAGTEHMKRAPGLRDTSASATIVYDDGAIGSYIQRLRPGLHTFDYGPEGNVAGKPRHQQTFIVTDAPHRVTVGKSLVVFTLSLEAAAAPTIDMYNGGVF